MRRVRRSGKGNTPLDDKQRALIEQQEKLRQKMDRLQRLIEDAPKVAEEQERRRREELARSSRRTRRSDIPVLQDTRYEHVMHVSVAASRPSRKTLKAEKRQARLKFLVLFILLVLVLLWLNHMRS